MTVITQWLHIKYNSCNDKGKESNHMCPYISCLCMYPEVVLEKDVDILTLNYWGKLYISIIICFTIPLLLPKNGFEAFCG